MYVFIVRTTSHSWGDPLTGRDRKHNPPLETAELTADTRRSTAPSGTTDRRSTT
jgi:hypothetical protein